MYELIQKVFIGLLPSLVNGSDHVIIQNAYP